MATATIVNPRHRPDRERRRPLTHVFLIASSLILLYPVLWMLAGSFKTGTDVLGASLVPETPTLQNYVDGWQGVEYSFGHFLLNSFAVCALAVIGNVCACAMAAYAFARLDFRFRRVLFVLMLGTMMLPAQVTMIPTYSLFNALGWVNTFVPLVLGKFLATDGFFVFLMVQFIRSIPRELDEAAAIDGCGPIQTFLRIGLPLMTPALVTTAVFTFIWTYDDLMGQTIYLNDTALYTVPMALNLFIDSAGQSSWGALFAMSIVSLLPILLVFLFFQKRLVEGVATTGLK